MIITTNRTFLGNLVSPILLISMFLTARSVPITLNEASDIVYGAVCDSYSYFEVEMPDPCQDLNITVIPLSGNPDIYVSRTRTEPTKRMLTWASVDDSSLMISHWDPESAPGTYYVGVYNDCMDQSDPATFKIQAFEANSTEDDIYLNPSLTFNKLVAAEDYEYFRFCVPKCADVTVTLENCLDSSICPTTYSYPELIVSRTEVDPTINDYAYLLATTTRRYITVNHTDPAGRDANGYQTGSYYVGVYGWCTPDEYVTNWEFDGPCSYANNSLFNVTVELNFWVQMDDNKCTNDDVFIYNSIDPDATAIQSEEVVEGTVNCFDYVYYTIDVPDTCTSLNIWLGGGSKETGIGELAIGKYPNLRPTFDNLQWTSYELGDQNVTIEAWDPNFDGGKECGPFNNETCQYVIGVLGYCLTSDVTSVDFRMIATLTPVDSVYGVLQTDLTISPYEDKRFEFCISQEMDVAAQLLSWTSSCDCPNSYSNLEMMVSRTNPEVSREDLAWRISHHEDEEAVYLLQEDPDTRPGYYYLNVNGWCTKEENCENQCTCAPCENLQNSKFGLFVTDNLDFDHDSDVSQYLGACGSEGSSDYGCGGDTCSQATALSTDKNGDDRLNDDEIAGVVIGIVLAVLLIILAVYVAYRYHAGQVKYSDPNADNQSEDTSVRSNKPIVTSGNNPNYEMTASREGEDQI